MPNHRAVATTALGVFDEILVETPPVGRKEVLIKHAYAGMVALDTYQADLGFFVAAYPQALGLAASGVVASVGPDVKDLKVGDRVAAFTFHGSRYKATQEYSIQPRSAVAKIPNDLGLAEAATIPDNFAEFLRENVMPKILPQLLELGLIKPSKLRLMNEGTFKDRVGEGLGLLRNNKVSGEKVIVKIDP